MFEMPSSPKYFLFSKDEKACLIIADLSHVKIASTQELHINVKQYLSKKHSRSDKTDRSKTRHCLFGGKVLTDKKSVKFF